ncbi:MAG TPA: outer membrane beta-barrel protein [Vicinamibacterales bacterium]|nr:outer membrane beta-barrel protein [Vicinamibacterales bacterium]
MNPTRHLRTFVSAAIALALLSYALPATAQTPNGATRIGGFVSGAVGSGQSTATVGLSASYRFTPRFGVEGDLTHLSDLTIAEFVPTCLTGTVCGPGSFHARVSSVTANFVAELPSGMERVRPYVAAGGGAARIRRDARGIGNCNPCERQADMRPVISAGGGVDVLVWRGLGFGLDVRYQRVYEDERIYRPTIKHLTRVGSLVSYRF